MRAKWIPEIMYEEDPNGASHALPFVVVPPEEVMPRCLFIWESRDTGEIEPGPRGEDLPVMEYTLRQYAMMDALKEGLTPTEYDRVREVLGLESMGDATRKGEIITENVRSKSSHRE